MTPTSVTGWSCWVRAWIPAGHIPPIVMDVDVTAKCMDMIDEAIGETEKELRY